MSPVSDDDFMNMGAPAQTAPVSQNGMNDDDFANYKPSAKTTKTDYNDPASLMVKSIVGAFLPDAPPSPDKVAAARESMGDSPNAVPSRLTGYGANVVDQVPLLGKIGSAGAAAFGQGQGNTFDERYNDLQDSQKAMRIAGQESNPGATTLGKAAATELQLTPLIAPLQEMAGYATAPKNAAAVAETAQNPWLNKSAQVVPTQHDPMTAMKAISDGYFNAIDKANTLYDFPKALGEGRSVKAPQVKNYLDTIIDDVANSPAPHEARAQVGTLQRIADKLPDDGTVPVNDLLDLRKFTNRFFDPARMTDRASTYGKFNSVIDSGLATAKQEVPNFEKALDIADDYWRNGVSQPYNKNKVLQKMWSPSDAHNLKMVDEGYLDEPADLTKQRADNMVNNVKDVHGYNAVRRTLPDDVGASFDQAVLKNIAPNRVAAFLKTVKSATNLNPLDTALNVKDTVFPYQSPETQTLRTAVRNQDTYTPLSSKNDVAQAAYENLVKAHMRGEGSPLKLSAPPIYGEAPVEPSAPVTQPQRLLPRGGSDTYYQPQNRQLTYQPRADYEVTPEGFVQRPREVFSEPTSRDDKLALDSAARENLTRQNLNYPRKQLTYQPRPDFIGTTNGIVQPPPTTTSDPFLLGTDQGMPIGTDAELEAIKKNPRWPQQARGGPVYMAKGGRVMPRPRKYPALEERKKA